MGRPYEFDRQETLTRAMDVFWEKGYRATSIQNLVDKMGIKRGSIYNTFGDKHQLFIEAIEHYGDVVTTQMIEVLQSPGSPVENIKRFFNSIVESSSNPQNKGCLISNTVVELAPHDDEAADVVTGILEKIQSAFLNCLNKAVKLGELPPKTNTHILSSFLATSTHGLIVTGKSAIDRGQLKDVVGVIISTLE